MARTRASVGAKISSGKSSKVRSNAAPPPVTTSSSGDKSSRSTGGGNSVCPRETPKWQKPITTFFITKHNESRESDDEKAAGSSKPKPKRNIIESSDEEISPGKPKNNALDETIELETLNGDDSHKIEEYYPHGSKGKGVGKKTKLQDAVSDGDENSKDSAEAEDAHNNCTEGKENIDTNIESKMEDKSSASDKDSSSNERKREREDCLEGEENLSKKLKVN